MQENIRAKLLEGKSKNKKEASCKPGSKKAAAKSVPKKAASKPVKTVMLCKLPAFDAERAAWEPQRAQGQSSAPEARG